MDVPNAVIMLIENAERYGLSQLHQLRGRIGRGKYPSTCIFLSDARGEEANERLKIMCSTDDGFKIADEDLRLRGRAISSARVSTACRSCVSPTWPTTSKCFARRRHAQRNCLQKILS